MSEDMLHEPGAARVTGRAPALRPSVPLYRHMVYSSGLSNALDFVVLAHIHFMCEDGQSFSVDELVEALRREGVSSANGKGLVGSKAVYESVARLRRAGFLHRSQENGGSFSAVEYTFFEFPTLNPHWNPSESSDSTRVEPVPLTGETAVKLPTSNSVSAGQTASPDKARADKARADRRSGKRRVSAGQTASPDRRSGTAPPPHPPEEEDSSSPYPLTGTTGTLPSQRAAAATVSEEERAAATRFLQQMKRFPAGAATASKAAPRLVQVMRVQGWPGVTGLDDEHMALLEAEILRNTGGAKSWDRCLPGWVDDLRLYDRVRSSLGSAQGAGARERCPEHPGRYRIGCMECALAVPD
ncbi:hypothetical protein AB0L54_33085 [Streptomyces sp. NPDC052196]|uniref:hypothetical protein n=1 Tax=Streptomyces sp. NPDC052196 TaxID=3156691 RepID=UPI0034412EA5